MQTTKHAEARRIDTQVFARREVGLMACVSLDRLPIDQLSERQVIEFVFDSLASGRGGWMVTVNLDILR